MDAKTEQMLITMGAGVIKKGLITLGSVAATHGIISGSETETFVSIGMALVGLGWSFWQDYGKAIVLSQLEVLKAKSLAQAEKMRSAGVAPVTVQQIANQSSKMNAAEVTKVVATLPAEVQSNIVPVAKVLLLAFALSFLLAPDPASAQLKRPQITGNIVADTKANLGGSSLGLTGDPINDIVAALDAKMLPDLQYALKLATASGSKVTAPCYKAWIDIIQTRQDAVKDEQMPDPAVITKFEKLVELRNSLQPDSAFMVACSPVANMVKKDIIGFIGQVMAGGAGLAALGL